MFLAMQVFVPVKEPTVTNPQTSETVFKPLIMPPPHLNGVELDTLSRALALYLHHNPAIQSGKSAQFKVDHCVAQWKKYVRENS